MFSVANKDDFLFAMACRRVDATKVHQTVMKRCTQNVQKGSQTKAM